MTQEPAAPAGAFFWRGRPSILAKSFKRSTQNLKNASSTSGRRFSPPIESQAAAQKAADKRAALLRGRI